MTQFLWQLDIEKLPLGWEDVYLEALANYPNGQIVADGPYYDGDTLRRAYMNPVGFREKLLLLFNKYKQIANELYESLGLSFNSDAINQLLKCDIILYSIIFDWVDTEKDFSVFDPNKIEENLFYIDGYFSSSDMDFMVPFQRMKFIQLNQDYTVDF